MLRGTSRNVIVVKTDSESMFESAYFIMKKGSSAPRCDIVREANRIIDGGGVTHRSRPSFAVSACLFLAGAVAGAVATAVAFALLR